MRTTLGVVFGVLASLIGLAAVAVVVGVALLQTGALNGVIEDAVAARVNHPVQLEQAPSLGFEDGALTLSLGPLSVANADWAQDQHDDFARIQEVQASVRVLPLLSGQVELPQVVIDSPQLHLARAADGRVNWPEAGEPGGPVSVPKIENLVIRDADVTYADAAAGADAHLVLGEVTGRLGGDQDLALEATGTLQDSPLELRASGGSLAELLGKGAMSEPAKMEATVGKSRITAQATSFQDVQALDATVRIDANQTLVDILSRMGIATADLPPFSAGAKVEPAENGSRVTADVTLEGASLKVDGKVDDLSAPRQGFSADIDAQGSQLAALLGQAGVEVSGKLPAFQLTAHVVGKDGAYQVDMLDAQLGDNKLTGQAQVDDIGTLDGLNAKLALDAPKLEPILASFGIASADLPPFEAKMQVEPGKTSSLVTADLSIGGATVNVDGKVDDLSAPMQGFSINIDAQSSKLAALLERAGVEVSGELPASQLTAHVVVEDGAYRIDGLDAQLGDNKITGQAQVDNIETLEGLEAKLAIDAPKLASILTGFDLPYAEQMSSAKVNAEVTQDRERTTVTLNGDVAGDTIALQGGYEGGITAFKNPRADLHLEGSALGALPAQLGITRRPIESYRIDAKVEERSGASSPVELDATIENAHLVFDGTVDDLRAFKGIDGKVHLEGRNPAAIQRLFELPPVSLPPYDLAGQVTWRGDDIKIADLDGKVGDSDMQGDIAIDIRPQPPDVTADLHSDRLDLDDLAGLIGATPATGEGETASAAQEKRAAQRAAQGRLLPKAEVNPKAWLNLNMDVRYDADRIESDYLPIDRVRLHVVSKEGWISVDPLVTGLADGKIVGFASLDGTQDPVAGDFDIRLEALQLQDMLAKLGVGGEGLGEIDGRIRLEGKGRSVDALLGSADGQIVLSMTGGSLDSLILEALGLDIAESIAVLLDSANQSEEDKVPIRCAIVNLQLDQGIATTRPVVIDTTDSKITVDGTINLKDETLDVMIQSHPKDASLLSANQPIHVDGPLLSPSINPAPGEVENEALGWLLAPVAAVLPFFDLGTEQDSPCAGLVAQAKDAAAERPK